MINFVRTGSPHYALVQQQLLELIQRHLRPRSYSETKREPVAGCLNFTLFIAKHAEVLMSHGAADKSYHWKSDGEGHKFNNVRGRQHLLVPGPFLAERIVASPKLSFGADQVHVVGWPRLDLLFEQQDRRPPRVPGARKRVLWAPTHDFSKHGEEQESFSSYPAFLPYVERMQQRYDFSVSLHPRNRTDKAPTERAMVDCDVVITDYGTMVYEAWALGKQVIFPFWLIGERMQRYGRNSAEAQIFKRRIGLHADSFDEMCEMIDAEAPLDGGARAFIDHYLEPRYARCSSRRVAEVLTQLDAQRR